MQTASSNFAHAVSASSGVWAPPQVHADWAGDGYGGDASIDDLSPLVGKPITINQALDDGMPSEVTVTSGRDATSKATMPVGGRVVSGTNFTGPQYWSLDNSSSPLSGYDRDVAALTISPGLVTSGGIERVTLFTGRMADVAVTGKAATLSAVSATRQKMTKAVQPPPIYGDALGLEATWPVSWSLYQCGIYVSPPPRSGCRLWMPMHGSAQPFLPAVGRKPVDTIMRDDNDFDPSRLTFLTGPYLTGADLARTTARSARMHWSGLPLAAGTDLLTTAGNAGRLEFWIRGDSTNAVGSPTELAGIFIAPGNGSSAWFGVDLNRKVFVNIVDNAGHNVTLSSSATLPTDGAWYFVGAAYDVANKRLWTVNNFSGSNVVETQNASTLVTTGLAATEDYTVETGVGSVQINACLPIAEVHLTTGAQASPDNYPWLNDSSYTATWSTGAVLRQSQLGLVALAEPKPREAWEFISQWAQAELAVMRTDELDRFCYLSLAYWTEAAQQTVADTWSTAVNVDGNFSITRDPTKVRNEITVTFNESQVRAPLTNTGSGLPQESVYLGFTAYALPPGTSTIVLPLPSPVVSVAYIGDPFALGDGSSAFIRNYLSANTASDGSGSYATDSTTQITVRITSWTAGQVTLTVVNHTSTTYYTVHNNTSGNPYISIYGSLLAVSDNASVTVRDSASVAARGTRGLTVALPGIQDRDSATRVAYNLLSRSLRPRPTLKVKLRADPRRQPGDLVTFTDPGNTNASGTWRSAAVDTTLNGADATQQVVATKASLIGVWGTSTWDDCAWGA